MPIDKSEFERFCEQNSHEHQVLFEKIDEQTQRVRGLELWKARVEGALSMVHLQALLLSAVVSLIVTVVIAWWKH